MVYTVLLPLFIYVRFDTRGYSLRQHRTEPAAHLLADFPPSLCSVALISLRVHSQIVPERLFLWILHENSRILIEKNAPHGFCTARQ